MKVIRKIKIKTTGYALGDQIIIKLKDGRKFSATCHRKEGNRALFVFDQIVSRMPMNENGSTEGGYLESDIRRWLHSDFYDLFPKKIKKSIVRDNGEYVRLLYAYEVFGDDYPWEHDEIPDDQLPLMQKRRPRIALDLDDDMAAWWLRDVVNSTYFAYVYASGTATNGNASNSNGVRPAFTIMDPQSPPLVGGSKEGKTVYSEF